MTKHTEYFLRVLLVSVRENSIHCRHACFGAHLALDANGACHSASSESKPYVPCQLVNGLPSVRLIMTSTFGRVYPSNTICIMSGGARISRCSRVYKGWEWVDVLAIRYEAV